MSLYLGEIYGKVTVDNNPALDALRRMRRGMDDTARAGKASTDKLQAQAERHAVAVEKAADRNVAAKKREIDAVAAVRVAEARLAEERRKHSSDSARVAQAEERLAQAHRRVADAQDNSARSARNLEMVQRRVAASSREIATEQERVSRSSRRASTDFTRMTNDMNTSSRAGRTFTASIAMVTAGLTAVTPAAGAAGASLLAGAGHTLTLAASMGQLAGVAALIPAGLMAASASAGVMAAAFSGIGDAMKAVNDQANAFVANPRLAAMAVEDAMLAITVAEENAAEAQVRAAERVSDAKRSLQDTVEAVAEARVAAARAVEMAERREAEASRDVADAEKALAKAKKGDEDGVVDTEKVIDAERKLADARLAQSDAVRDHKDAVADAAKAEREGSRRIADAQKAVKDAAAAAERAQVDAARAVAQAHRNLERVQLQQADTAAKAGKESADAMNNLTPAAQDAVRALLRVKDQLTDIRKIAQENFFTGFSGPLLALSGALGPQMATGVGAIASALGSGAQMFMGSLERAFGNGVLDRLLRGVADSVDVLNRAIDPLVQSFVTLGIVGMDYMPGLSGWIADMAEKFNEFIQTAAADGSLKRWIDDGIQGLKDLWSVADSIVGIFGALTLAAQNAGINSTLAGLAAGLRDVEAVMQGEVFQTTMTTIFSGAQAGAEGLLAALGPIGESFRTGADSLARFFELSGQIAGLFVGGVFTALSSPGFGSGLTTFLEGVLAGVEEIVPKLPGLADSFGRILAAIAPVVEALGPTTVEVLTIFADAIAGVLEDLSPLLTALADSPVAVGIFLGVIGSASLLGAIGTFTTHVRTLTGAFRLLWLAITGPVGWVIAIIGAQVAAIHWWATETETGRRIVAGAWLAIQIAVDKFSRWFNGIFLPGAMKVLGVLSTSFTWLYENVINPVWTWIGDTIERVWLDFIKPTFERFGDIVRGIPGAFESAKKGIKTAWDAIKEIAKAPVRFVVDTVINDGLIGTFNKIPGVDLAPVALPKGFAHGGVIPGSDPGKRDNVLAAMRSGEGVLVPEATKGIGGAATIDALNRAGNTGGVAAVRKMIDSGPVAGAFMGNRNQIARHGAYYLDVAAGMGPWNFKGAANMWDGAAGVKVKTGRGKHQGYVTAAERGGGILGYTTGTNIDMSPSWMAQLGAIQRRTVAAHEIGHALGLPHSNASSIMQPNLGNMASVPTANDIRNLQTLYPGGSGKAGSPAPENPFAGMVGSLVAAIREAFPGGGMFVDAGIGLATSGMQSVIKFVSDIGNNIGDFASDVADNVVSGIRDFFGGAAMTPTLMDGGGWLHDTGRPQLVDHRRHKPDAFTPYDQWKEIIDHARNSGGVTVQSTVEYVGERPEEFADRERRRMMDTLNAYA